jgi:hypothetical protein
MGRAEPTGPNLVLFLRFGALLAAGDVPAHLTAAALATVILALTLLLLTRTKRHGTPTSPAKSTFPRLRVVSYPIVAAERQTVRRPFDNEISRKIPKSRVESVLHPLS